jgi:elongation factor P hydroxylase
MTAGLSDAQIAGCFNRGVGRQYGVRLVGGASEPLYEPALPGRPATIRYTRDYAASALHELAHWCIAGARRRRLVDYGYWYQAPPRTELQQEAFIRVEVPVQALEARLSAACGLIFRVSMDDLEGTDAACEVLAARVQGYLQQESNLPVRAARLIDAFQGYRVRLRTSERWVVGPHGPADRGAAA